MMRAIIKTEIIYLQRIDVEKLRCALDALVDKSGETSVVGGKG